MLPPSRTLMQNRRCSSWRGPMQGCQMGRQCLRLPVQCDSCAAGPVVVDALTGTGLCLFCRNICRFVAVWLPVCMWWLGRLSQSCHSLAFTQHHATRFLLQIFILSTGYCQVERLAPVFCVSASRWLVQAGGVGGLLYSWPWIGCCCIWSGFSFFFFLYILPDALLSIIGRCTLYTRGCRMKAYKLPYLNYRRVILPAHGVAFPAKGTSS